MLKFFRRLRTNHLARTARGCSSLPKVTRCYWTRAVALPKGPV